MHTFLEVTAIIADGQNLSAKFVPTLLRRVRLFDKHGLLPVAREDTGRREGRLDLNGAAQAAIYNELLEMGFDVEMAREVQYHVNHNNWTFGRPPQTLIDDAIVAIEAGQPVSLVIRLMHEFSGKKHYEIDFEGAHDPRDERAAAALKLADDLKIVKVRAETRFDLNQILSPVIAAYREG
ncbi:MAG: hypothetical protein ACTHLA_04855 [Asticcacaulis sp.]|uniref:hypothetical protein n=1 Tax=Asticcacaulis sp. TaxID=1872648 RepID=UPI003F7C97D9